MCVGFGFLFALPAVILGRSALDTPRGNLARTGMYTGFVGMAVSLLSVTLVIVLVGSGGAAEENGGGAAPDESQRVPFEALPGPAPEWPDDDRLPPEPAEAPGENPF